MSWLRKEPDPDSWRGRQLAKGLEREERLRAKVADQKVEADQRKADAAERKQVADRAMGLLVPPRKCPSCRKRMKAGAWVCHHCGRDARVSDDHVVAVARVPGGVRVAVVGEARCQDALARITGSTRWESVAHDCEAVLIREPSNPHDPNAVAVYVDDLRVGYLSRGDASDWVVLLDALDARHGARVSCAARIAGRGPGSETMNMGVFLDVAEPSEELLASILSALDETAPVNDESPRQRED